MDEASQQEEFLFDAARRLSDPAHRRAFLEASCAGNPQLRQRLEELLFLTAPADEFFASGAAALDAPVCGHLAGGESVGDRIGHYRLRERIGEGGSGVVYVAEQEEPVRRKVALKIIKLGMDTKAVVARFEAEKHALALMDHPSIAQVLDAGATDTGRPYFVMELVRGTRITQYCDAHTLSTTERLALFIKVCQAVQHAHQKGVIHRDLKPSNILVTQPDPEGPGVPKIIDFGIAKAVEGRLSDLTVYTELHQFLGTPAYMSPEQAGMVSLDIDTRSDIYSLGVLLYELLTGKTPFECSDLLRAGPDEMRRILREKEPRRPSTRLSTLSAGELTETAARRRAEAPRLIRLLRGDLDWIVMKCLEKDRARRYETANGLASDITRHLSNEPVKARPPSRRYRLHKLVRRNKLVVGGVIVVAAALLLGLAGSLWEALRASRAEQVARAEALRAGRAEAAMQEELRSSYLAEAVALRASHDAGRRFEALDRLKKGAALRPTVELRNAAIATMTLPDLHLAGELAALVPAQTPLVPDSACRHYVFADDTGALHLCSIPENRVEVDLPGTGHPVTSLQFSPDDRWLAVKSSLGDRQATLCLWNLPKRTVVLQPREDVFDRLAFTSDSKGAVAYFRGQPLRVYDLESRQVAFFVKPPVAPKEFAPHPDGKVLAVSGQGRHTVDLLDLRSGAVLRTLEHPDEVSALIWNGDGKRLACCCDDRIIYLWNAQSGQRQATLIGHVSQPVAGQFSRDNERFASVGWDGLLRLWNGSTGAEICHRPVSGFLLQLDPTDRWLLAPNREGKLGLFEIASGHECRTLRFSEAPHHEPWSCTFSPDGRLLVSPHAAGVRFWSAESGRLLSFEGIGDTRSVLFESDCSLITQGSDGLRRWSVAPRGQVGAETLAFGPAENLGWPTDYAPLASMDAGHRLLAVVRDGQACVIDLRRNAEKARFAEAGGFEFAALSAHGTWCAAGHWKRTGGLVIYSLETGALLTNLPAETSHAVFSPDDRWLAVPGYHQYTLWDTATWKRAWDVARVGSGFYIRGVAAFDSSSRMVALAQGNLVRLHDAATGTELATLESPEPANISALAFAPDGSKIAVCKWNQTIELWNLRQVRAQLAAMKLDW